MTTTSSLKWISMTKSCSDQKQSTSISPSKYWASKSCTLSKVFATWWITILIALQSLRRSKSVSPIATTPRRSSSSTSNTLSYMSRQEFDLREEQRKFDELMVVYQKLQKVVAIHKAHPTWFVSSSSVKERADAIWNQAFASIPTTFLIELQETVNERQITLLR